MDLCIYSVVRWSLIRGFSYSSLDYSWVAIYDCGAKWKVTKRAEPQSSDEEGQHNLAGTRIGVAAAQQQVRQAYQGFGSATSIYVYP